jgi:hypothetical protein
MATKAKQEASTPKKETTTGGLTHYQKIVQQCERLDVLNPPYSEGGGHGGWEYNPTTLDCSGGVSLVMHLAGYDLAAPMVSGEFETWGEPGPGLVTIYAGQDHIFLEFANKCWAWSSPTSENGWQPAHHYGDPPTIDGPYVARHPPGLSGPAGQVEVGELATGGGGAGGSASSYLGVSTASKAAAISTFIQLPGLLGELESEALKGQRSLMNDTPLLPFIEELTTASLRNFTSMPDGSFYAFIPDYFGGLTNRQAYWEIDDVEIIDGSIDLSDDALATHVYVVGDTDPLQGITYIQKSQTSGVVTVFNAFMADFITGINDPKLSAKQASKEEEKGYEHRVENEASLANRQKALDFLQKYGARPYFEEAPMIRSHYFEMFLAYQRFCLLWSKQFEAQFELTFMPELFPGGLVKFTDYGIQCYIQEVSHRGNYTSGFTTSVALTAPSALPQEGRKGVSAGMVRAGILSAKNVKG